MVLLRFGLVEGDADLATVAIQLPFFFDDWSPYGADAGTVDRLGVLWSLSVEEHFYPLWPTLFVGMIAARARLCITVLLLVVVLLWRSFHVVALSSLDAP